MLKVGITGGIGSGKSTVCAVFELLGIPVFYADEEAKKIVGNDAEVLVQVIAEFGKDVLNEEGKPDRKKLASIVFNDDKKLKILSAIIHPAVTKRFLVWCKEKESSPYVLKEAAILFESTANVLVDRVITVSTPVELRIKRVMMRDHSTSEEIKRRMKNQMSDEEKIKISDFVIVNDEQKFLIEQVLSIHKLLIASINSTQDDE